MKQTYPYYKWFFRRKYQNTVSDYCAVYSLLTAIIHSFIHKNYYLKQTNLSSLIYILNLQSHWTFFLNTFSGVKWQNIDFNKFWKHFCFSIEIKINFCGFFSVIVFFCFVINNCKDWINVSANANGIVLLIPERNPFKYQFVKIKYSVVKERLYPISENFVFMLLFNDH